MELMAKEGKIAEAQVAAYIAPSLLHTVAALHAAGVVHRNIKPEHVMYEASEFKLIDFFEVADLGEDRLTYRVGALEYMAPEVLDKPDLSTFFNTVSLRERGWVLGDPLHTTC